VLHQKYVTGRIEEDIKMKRVTAIGLFFLISSTCFAENIEDIDALIREGLNKNFDSIREEATDLSETDRLEIYNQHKKSHLKGGLINVIPNLLICNNFGIGNFIQGDTLSGVITLSGNLVGIGLLLYGFADQRRIEQNLTGDIVPMSGFFVIGPIVSWAFSMFGTVRAFVYPVSYNDKLKTALQINQVSVDIEPSLSIRPGQKYELTLVRIKY
jgi:hypothetical protein